MKDPWNGSKVYLFTYASRNARYFLKDYKIRVWTRSHCSKLKCGHVLEHNFGNPTLKTLPHRRHSKKKSFIHPLTTRISIHIKTCLSGIPGILNFSSLRLHIAKLASIQAATSTDHLVDTRWSVATSSWCVLKLHGGCSLSPRTSLVRSLNSVCPTKIGEYIL
jgi:hypothetical protein